jgi:AraC-like DNA-binding protein
MTSAAHDCVSFRFSTDNIPPEQRLSTVHEALDRSLGGRLTIRPFSDGPFCVEMTGHRLGRAGKRPDAQSGLSVIRMTSTMRCTIRRTPDSASVGQNVILHVHETGRRIVSQLGREGTVEAGGGLLVSAAYPSTQVIPDASRFVLIGVPHQLMKALAPALEDAFIRPLPPDTGVLRLLLRYLDVLEDGDALSTIELQRAVTTHIHDLCALAAGATRDAAEVANGRGLRAARLRAIKADIAQNLTSGDLSPAALALRQGVTPRYIHKLFESEGTTLSQFVLGQRLARVHRMLADPRYAHRTIGALAYDVGFADLSNFNRQFRRHFGMTPSELRAARY